ncbi:ABC transporter ATP-binding protein [Paenibacillus methanolicus]|uniref:ABC-type multidrug transport system ATPase subunit n=1 Tax=Paenibacillus methanolicus TaxID=582686 RepID=A0A5S5BRT7_9BACL|nr:ABC transporter ATP-binding protein [Paenibacillus methanolicus]TYP69624.1 ABC-type multidrug transport system ATPase subunit [Paenibacillus methanolicus]
MLQLEGVTKRFGRREVLQRTDLSLENGVIGLLGPNGAGKTTLLRLLATVYEPTAGSIRLNGISWSGQTEEARKRLGYLPQHVGLFPALSAQEYLDYVAILRGMASGKERGERIRRVLREVNLEEQATTKIRKFSGGMKQRLGIAQAIIHDPELLLVDEPTAGLDPEERLRFRGLVRRLAERRIVLLSTHIMEDVSMTCDSVCMMKQGRLQYFGALEEVLKLAAGKVWTTRVTADVYRQLEGRSDVRIIQASDAGGLQSLRLLAEERPIPDAQPAEPSLEEGYMKWLKEH